MGVDSTQLLIHLDGTISHWEGNYQRSELIFFVCLLYGDDKVIVASNNKYSPKG
jgi:hypothetical protein